MNKVRFRDLSWPLKVGIMAAWIVCVLWLLFFFGGIIAAFILPMPVPVA
ncbi:hypothetical protein GF386_05285 [Candidatus Pacearchaeota archaeon]|nr:hypothetical protein [Candidatus Pacearchaeota archaeon]